MGGHAFDFPLQQNAAQPGLSPVLADRSSSRPSHTVPAVVEVHAPDVDYEALNATAAATGSFLGEPHEQAAQHDANTSRENSTLTEVETGESLAVLAVQSLELIESPPEPVLGSQSESALLPSSSSLRQAGSVRSSVQKSVCVPQALKYSLASFGAAQQNV